MNNSNIKTGKLINRINPKILLYEHVLLDVLVLMII